MIEKHYVKFDNPTNNLLGLLILLLPFTIYKYVDFFRINQEAWLKLFVIFAMVLWILKSLKDKESKLKKSKLNFPIFIFVLVISISLLLSKCKIISIRDYMIFFTYIILYFLIINNIKNKNEFNSLIQLFFITSSLVAIYTILHYYGIIPYLKEFGPVISTIGQKNWTSNYLALISPLMFSCFLLEKLKRKKNLYFIILSIIYTTLMICQSRGIWISISLTSIFSIYIILKFKLAKIFKKNQKWLILLILTFSIITIIYSTDNPLNKSAITVTERAMSTFDEKDPSINTRILIWKTTLEMIKDKLIFGSGIGTFKMNYLNYQAEFLQDNPDYIEYWGHAREAHNEYLQMAAELGIVGLGIFLSIIFIFCKLTINYLKKESSDKKKIIVFGLFMGITSFLIHSLFTFPLHVPALGSAFFILLGLTVIYIKDFNLPEYRKKIEKISQINLNREIKVFSWLNMIYIIFILIITIWLIDSAIIRPYLAEVYAYKGKENISENNSNEALSNFKYAAKLDPYNGRILLNLGATYYNLGIFEEAEKILQQSKKYYNDRNIYRNLGLCYMQLENYGQAEEEFKHATHLDPKFSKAYFDLAYLYAKQEEYDKAIIEWNKILEIEPNFSEKYNVLYYLGLTYAKKQMPDRALEYFLEALELVPEGSPIIEEIEKEIYDIYRSNPDK